MAQVYPQPTANNDDGTANTSGAGLDFYYLANSIDNASPNTSTKFLPAAAYLQKQVLLLRL